MTSDYTYHDKATTKPTNSDGGLERTGLDPLSLQRTSSRPSNLYRARSHIDYHSTFHSIGVEDEDAPQETDTTVNHVSPQSAETKHTPGLEKTPHESPDGSGYILVDWDGPDDPMNPKNKPTWKKWVIVAILALGAYVVTSTSSAYTTIYEQMNEEFGSSRELATLGLTTFVFGLGLGPMFLGPLSEFYGRYPIYVASYLMFSIWLVPCAVAQNIQTMLIVRFFDGLSGSAFLSVAGGTVGDMFDKRYLAAPMMVYSASPFLGPGTAPIWSSFVNYYINWRWTFYVLIIVSVILLVCITIFVPETYAPAVLRAKARKLRKETGDQRYKARIELLDRSITRTVLTSLYRPFMILFLDPMCFCLCLFSAILLGILYLFFGAFPLVFTRVYDFNGWQNGLVFFGITTGMILAIFTDPAWHYLYIWQLDRYKQKTGEKGSEPEYRLPSSMIGSWFCVVGLFWFGWTIYPGIHWIVPIIGTGFFACGIILVYVGIFTYLVESFPLYAASALSANSFARSIFGGAFPLFGDQMYNTLDFHWATTLLALLTLVMAPFPTVFYIYGKRLRARSKFSPEKS